MRKLRKTMAILLTIVMMETMPGAVSSITVYGAQTSESEDTATLAAASGLGVASHTQEEIIEHIKDSGALITDDTVYKTSYSYEEPYSAGELDESTLNSGIAMLNNIRYIAGLNYDVTLDDEFNKECQAGALIGKIYGTIDHHPKQPSGMSDELYQLAYKGCSESNIAWGYSTLNKCIVLGWMSDEDDSNISRVGHRAWCLNPTMGKTGFGVVDNYYNMHSFDRSYTSSIKNISWPAQNMPVEYFEKNMPWSIFTGSSETADSVKVTLTRQSDGKVWNFSQDSADGYFNVTDYIQSGTIIFRPNDITGYNEGDVFTVSVTGVKTPLSYTVTFFSLGSDLGHIHTFGNSSFVVTGADLDAMTLEGTMACDSCGQKFNATEGTITNILTENVTCGFKGYVQFKFTAKVYGTQWSGTNFYYINGLPHKYGDVEFTWNGTECTADATCSRCGDVSSEKCTVTSRTTATCTKAGKTIYTAEYDGQTSTKTVDTPAMGHSFTDYVSNNDATCTADGTKTAVCDNGCGETDTIADEGTKLEHKFTDYVSDNNATCQKDGTKTAECDYGCGATDTITDENSSTKAHKFTHYVSNNDATCTADGTKTAECDYGCGATDTITDKGTKLEHVFTEYVSNNDATCQTDGTKTAECDYGCGETDTIADEGSKTSHKFTHYVSNNNATCQTDGTKTAECDYGCGETDTIADEGSKVEHKFTKYESNNDATCQTDGTKTAECDYGCGATDTITDENSSTKAHKFTHYVSNNDATCTADGTKTAECDYGCGATDTITDKGTKLEHVFTKYVSNNDATCQTDGTKTAECDYGCGATDTVVDEGSKTSHKFTKYVSNGDATCQKDGTKTAECDYGCGTTDTVADEGSKTSHKFTKYVSNGDATCQKDGTKTAECDYGCGETDTITDEGSSTKAHKFTRYVSDNNSTCQKNGTKTAKCDYGCGTTDTIVDEGTKLDHKFTDYVYNGDATCQKDGTKTARCDYGCGETDTVVASGTRGSHSYGRYVSNNDATCMADGTKTATCAYCGAKTTTTDEGSKTAHRFTKYVSNGDATCESDETQTAQCDYGCGTRDTRVVSGTKLAHKFTGYISNNDATCSKDGTATAECDYGCGRTKTIVDEGTRKPHTSSGVWSVSEKATDKADGTLVDRCTECGQIAETQRIPQIDKVKLAYTICTYDGNAKKPGVSVYDVDGNTLDRTSYTVSYRNNKTSGDAAAVVTFKGDYAGSITASFVIKPKSVRVKAVANKAGGVKITWSKAASGTGYIVYRSVNGSSYRKYKTINGLSTTSMVDSGARKSGAKYAYKICVYRAVNGHTYTSAAGSAKSMYYMAAPSWKSLKNSSARAITVKYGKAAGATGYQIQYSTNGAMKSAKTVKVSGGSNVTKAIRSLRKNKKYYVRVRSFKNVGGRTYYSFWSTKKSVIIRK